MYGWHDLIMVLKMDNKKRYVLAICIIAAALMVGIVYVDQGSSESVATNDSTTATALNGGNSVQLTYSSGTTLTVSGENTISISALSSTSTFYCGIYCQGNLTINGSDGSGNILNIIASTSSPDLSKTFGIMVNNGNLTISNCVVNIFVDSSIGNRAIYVVGGDTSITSSVLNIAGSEKAIRTIIAGDDLTITDSDVTAISGTENNNSGTDDSVVIKAAGNISVIRSTMDLSTSAVPTIANGGGVLAAGSASSSSSGGTISVNEVLLTGSVYTDTSSVKYNCINVSTITASKINDSYVLCSEVSNQFELNQALNSGVDEVKLIGDITLSTSSSCTIGTTTCTCGAYVSSGKNVILDLNGHTLSTSLYNCICVENGGTLTVTDSSENGSISCSNGGNVIVTSGALTLLKCSISGSADYGVYVASNGNLTSGPGVSIEAKYSAISGNGTQTGANIVISGGTYTSDTSAVVYFPSTTSLTVTGGTFIGKTGFDIRAGTVSISNATININKNGTVDQTGSSGPSSWGMGIAIFDMTNYSNGTSIGVTVNNTTITGATYDIYCGEFKINVNAFDASALSEGYTVCHGVTLTVNSTTILSYSYTASTTLSHSCNISNVTFIGNSSSSTYSVSEMEIYGETYTIPSTYPTQTGYTFMGWYTQAIGGNEVISNSIVDVTANTILYAHWGMNTYALTGSISNGTVTNGSQSVTYGNNSSDIVFNVEDGYHMISYTVNGVTTKISGDNITTWTFNSVTDVSRNYTVSVATAVNTYILTLLTDSDNSGAITGSGTYAEDTKVIISAVPANGYEFVSWSDGGAQTHTITVTSDVTLTAVFKEVTGTTYTISASYNGNGTVIGNTTVASGDSSVFTIMADTDNKVSDVIVDGSSVGAVGSYIFSNVTSDHTISVIFETSEGTTTTVSDDGDVMETTEVSDTDGTAGSVSRTTTSEGNVNVVVELESSDGMVTTTAVNSSEGSSIQTTVSVESTVLGDTSEASVDDSEMAEALKQAQLAASSVGDDATVTVVISVVGDSSSSMTDVTVSQDSLINLTETGAGVEISTGTGTVLMDNSVLSNLEGGSLTVSIGEVDVSSLTEAQQKAAGDMTVIEASVMSGDSFVHELGGTATITMSYELKSGENPDNIQILYLKDDGTTETYSAVYDSVAGTVSFQTDHFSYYAITFESNDNSNLVLYIVAVVIIAIVAVAMIYWYMRVRKTE